MATLIEMPKLSDTMTTGKIISWTKQEGEPVEAGEAIAEVETDKATMELECFEDGTLLKILAQPNSSIPIGGPIAIVGKSDEDVEPMVKKALENVSVDSSKDTREKSEAQSSSPTIECAALKAQSGEEHIFRISPVAQRMAAEHGIDPRAIAGSGPSGRIVKRDIEAYLQRASSPVVTLPVETTDQKKYRDLPVTSLRETAARRLAESLGPIPHFYLEIDVDAEKLIEIKNQLRTHVDMGQKITLTDILVKACAIALRRHPEINSQWNGNFIRQFQDANIGIAVAGEKTLFVPVIRSCQCKSIGQITLERTDLIEKSQAGQLTAEEMAGGTFTISNLGMMGITRFKAVINPPQAAILAVGAIREEPVVKNGQVVAGKRMALTLSCDHRVFDGAEGARFMETLRTILESPMALCL